MKRSARFLILMSILFLTGCAHQNLQAQSQSVNNMQPIPGQYQAARNAASVQTKIVDRYVPIPVPGQLQPIPTSKALQTKLLKQDEAVREANKTALVTPTSNNFFNAMATYDYMPNALYVIYTSPMKITDIVLQPSEQMISEAAGDTLRWQVAKTYSGSGAAIQQHILVKPNLPDLENTMIITTNRRVYHLVLKSTSNDTYMVAVQWNYPDDMLQSIASAPDNSDQSAQNTDEPLQIDLSNAQFNYQYGMISGSKPSWYPELIFHTDRQTFIKFPKNFISDELPILVVADNNGIYGTMVNWRMKGRYMVVDQVLHVARLQTGVNSTGTTIVQIEMVGNS